MDGPGFVARQLHPQFWGQACVRQCGCEAVPQCVKGPPVELAFAGASDLLSIQSGLGHDAQEMLAESTTPTYANAGRLGMATRAGVHFVMSGSLLMAARFAASSIFV
jgi:hypothetical protein